MIIYSANGNVILSQTVAQVVAKYSVAFTAEQIAADIYNNANARNKPYITVAKVRVVLNKLVKDGAEGYRYYAFKGTLKKTGSSYYR